jgi:hypothetical protein
LDAWCRFQDEDPAFTEHTSIDGLPDAKSLTEPCRASGQIHEFSPGSEGFSAVSPLRHLFDSSDRFYSPEQNGVTPPDGTCDHIRTIMHAIRKIDIHPTAGPEHHLVSRSYAPETMRCGIILLIGFYLDDHSGMDRPPVVMYENASQKFWCDDMCRASKNTLRKWFQGMQLPLWFFTIFCTL